MEIDSSLPFKSIMMAHNYSNRKAIRDFKKTIYILKKDKLIIELLIINCDNLVATKVNGQISPIS